MTYAWKTGGGFGPPEPQAKGFFGTMYEYIYGPPPPTMEELHKQWQKSLKDHERTMTRQINKTLREQNKAKQEIRILAKKKDMENVKTLAMELVRSKKFLEKQYESKAQINSLGMKLREHYGVCRVAKCMEKSTEVMKMMNDLMSEPQLRVMLQTLSQEMVKFGLIEDTIEETLDVGDESDVSEAVEEEIAAVFDELNIDLESQTPRVSAMPKVEKEEPTKIKPTDDVDVSDKEIALLCESLKIQ